MYENRNDKRIKSEMISLNFKWSKENENNFSHVTAVQMCMSPWQFSNFCYTRGHKRSLFLNNMEGEGKQRTRNNTGKRAIKVTVRKLSDKNWFLS